jgi:general nucleoside transport system permease protein
MKFINFLEKTLRKILANRAFVSFLATIIAVVIGITIGFIIMLIARPQHATSGIQYLFGHWLSFNTMTRIGNWLYYATPLIVLGLSVAFAFKTGLFNIGATGQYTVGLFAALYVGIAWTNLGPFQWVVGLLMATLAGAIWGFFPGFLKARFKVHEVISSIMFNYIGMYFVNFLISNIRNTEGQLLLFDHTYGRTFRVSPNAFIPRSIFGFDLRTLFPNSEVDIGIIIALILSLFIYFVLYRTKFGFELRACGFNRHAAQYSGINENRSITLAMLISGALAGFGGGLFMLAGRVGNVGNSYKIVDVLLPEGFQGISVALLGLSNPFGVVVAGFFISFIQRGGFYMQTLIKNEIVDVIVAVIIYTSAISLIFQTKIANWLLKQKRKKKKEAET